MKNHNPLAHDRPIHVPAETEYRWKRLCKKCAKMEHTKETTQQVNYTPKFKD